MDKTISNNTLKFSCRACGRKFEFSLLEIKKKIIYLDQNILSYAGAKDIPLHYLQTVKRLEELANKQLIICPYSDIHDKETHICSNADNTKKRYNFIRKTSRAKRFYCKEEIEEKQLINAYMAFLEKKSKKYTLNLSEAISLDIHDWDSSLIVEIPWSITDYFLSPDQLREGKKNFSQKIFEVLPKWRSDTSSLEEDYKLEIKSHAKILLNEFLKLQKSKDIESILESYNFRVMHTLINIQQEKFGLIERLHYVKDFLNSEYFSSVPYINISSGLWALLKRDVKSKQYLTSNDEKKITNQVKGISFDIEHLSIFSPYCDAIFTEDRMAWWLREWSSHSLGGYNFKIFSKKTLNDFNLYLDQLEKDMNSKMEEELKIIEE